MMIANRVHPETPPWRTPGFLMPALMVFLLFSLLPQPAAAAARPFLVHTWSAEDGLPQNSVNCMAQTPDGYLWIGTRSGGLARFDGARFVTFNPQTTPELKDVEFETLSVDSRGTLWITAGNESIASVTDGKFRLVRERNAQPRWHPLHVVGEDDGGVYFAAYTPAVFRIPRQGSVNDVSRIQFTPPQRLPRWTVFQASDGALWVVTGDRRLNRVVPAKPGEPQSEPVKFPVPFDGPVEALNRSPAGAVWAAGGGRLGEVGSGAWVDQTPANGAPIGEVLDLVPNRDGSVWVWEEGRLRLAHERHWIVNAAEFKPHGGIGELKFFADARGELWVIDYGFGLWHVNRSGSVTFLTRKDGLPGVFITCWLEDFEGNIWIGTKEGGLARIRPGRFQTYTGADGIPGEVAQSVCEDAQGVIWVGTATGRLARRNGDRFEEIPIPAPPGVTVESVTVFPDAHEGIWIGTVKGSVLRFANEKITRPFPLEALRDRMADVVMQESNGRVWFGNGSGAYYWHTNQFTVFGRQRGFVEDLGVRALAEGPPGTLWFGTEPGEVWQYAAGRLTLHRPPAEWPNARVSALLPDADGSVWVGTLGGGLLRLANGRFTRITTENGLPDNSITQLLADEYGHLWGGTYSGIFRARRSDLEFVASGKAERVACSVFGQFDGLPSQAYSGWYQPACWRSRDGTLWFTTVRGLVIVDPRNVTINTRPPPVVIEEMRVDGKEVDLPSRAAVTEPVSRRKNGGLTIGPGRHYVEFRFTGLNFTAPDLVRFRWRLEGADARWREEINQRRASYGPLGPGQYTFRVQAANSDGIWNDAGAALAFTLLPHFWETWWFRSGLGAVLLMGFAAGIVVTMRRRHHLQMLEMERAHQLERERTRIAQDLHDDLGTSLTQINMLSGLVSHENTPASEIKDLTRQIRATSREMVSELNEIVWAVNPKNDRLVELLGYLGNFAEAFCRNSPVRCRLKFPDDLPDLPLTAEVRHNLFLAFKEAVNNAVRHAQATELWIEATLDQERLILRVRDNGRGIEAPSGSPGTGLGMENMRQRLERIAGACRITAGMDGGTTVEFQITLYADANHRNWPCENP